MTVAWHENAVLYAVDIAAFQDSNGMALETSVG